MKISIKSFISIVLILIPVLILTSCNSKGLPEGFNKDEVTEAAKSIVADANNRDYEAVHARIDGTLQGAISVEEIKKAWDPILDESGDFLDFDDVILSSKTGEEDLVYALALVKCSYENGKHTYTFYFDEDMTLNGLWMK